MIVPQRIKEMEKAILRRDFQVFGKLTMQVQRDQFVKWTNKNCVPDAYTECNRQTPAMYYDYYLVVSKVRVTLLTPSEGNAIRSEWQ